MSERVRVVARDDGQLVARKFVADPARLAHETAILRAARHPGVVLFAEPLLDAADGDLDTLWAGSHSLETQPPMTLSLAAGILAVLATTVADLHQAGVTHRRIWPTHVLLGRDGRPVLCGFGDAQQAPALTDESHQHGVADDVAALGQLLLTLLDAESSGSRRVRDKMRSQRKALRTLAERACHDDASRRPSARAFAAAVIELVPGADLPVDASAHRRARSAGAAARRADMVGEVVDVSPATSPADHTEPSRSQIPLDDTADVDPSDPFDRLRRTATEPPPREPVITRRRMAAMAVVIAITAGAALTTQSWSARSGSAASSAAPAPRATNSTSHAETPRATAGLTPSTSSTLPSSAVAAASPPTELATEACPPTQLATANLAADIDGDRCPDAVLIDDNVVSVGDRRWEIGQPGDAIALADWDCDGTATPALLRHPTGEIFVFDTWAEPGDEVSVEPLSTITDAAAISPTPGFACPDLVVGQRDGSSVTLPTSKE